MEKRSNTLATKINIEVGYGLMSSRPQLFAYVTYSITKDIMLRPTSMEFGWLRTYKLWDSCGYRSMYYIGVV